MRLASRTDANQKAIVAALRKIGCIVVHLFAVGDGVPDLLVGIRGVWVLFEIKDGKKRPSERKLTEAQKRFHARCEGYPVFVVKDIDEAVKIAMGAA